MHEAAVADSILRTILEQATQLDNAHPVSARISCGQFNRLNDEAMRFAFEAISQGTDCEGMRLDICCIPLQAKCKKCDATFAFDVYRPTCPTCGTEEYDFEPDAPLLLEEIEFE